MSEKKPKSRFQLLLDTAWQGIKHLIMHNGLVKLLAVGLSVLIWAGLVSQDESITRDKTFNNVNVSISGADTARRNGYIVTSDLNSLLQDVSCVAAVPQTQYENAEVSTYNLRVDLSRINSVGEQELKIVSTSSSTYGRVLSTTPASVTVNVEEYIVRQRIPVSLTTIGEVPTGWYMSTPTVDPSLVSVSGPRSLVQTISRARAVLNRDEIDWVEGTLFTNVDIVLYNRSGEPVVSNLLNATTESLTIDAVLLEATILPAKTFDVSELIQTTGSPARGYMVKDIRMSPESVTVAARSEVLEQLNELSLDSTTVNLKNLTETTAFQFKVQKPSDDAVLSNETVTVTVEIVPMDNAP